MFRCSSGFFDICSIGRILMNIHPMVETPLLFLSLCNDNLVNGMICIWDIRPCLFKVGSFRHADPHLQLWLIPENGFLFLNGMIGIIILEWTSWNQQILCFKTYNLNELLSETILDWSAISWCSILYHPQWLLLVLPVDPSISFPILHFFDPNQPVEMPQVDAMIPSHNSQAVTQKWEWTISYVMKSK